MSGGYACECKPQDRTKWQVMQRLCNHSAFSGYHYTPSDYSSVTCTVCGRVWRTKADYVATLPDYLRASPVVKATPSEQPQTWPGITVTGGQS